MDRSATYDFLLMFHIATIGLWISYRFREISVENRRFLPPCVLCTLAEGVLLGIWYRRLDLKKTRRMGLPCRGRSLTISPAFWIQYTNVPDGWTDGQTDAGRQQRPGLRIASCGKNAPAAVSRSLYGWLYTAE